MIYVDQCRWQFRDWLWCHMISDHSLDELHSFAEVLEVPIGTVMSRLSRGKAQLREAVARGAQVARPKVIPFPLARGGKQT